MPPRRRNVYPDSAKGSATLDDFPAIRSRPSKTNCTTKDTGPDAPDFDSPDYWWRKKNAIVDAFLDQRPKRAARPISVRGGTKLRDEAASEKYGEEERYRSKSWSSVLNEFLKWYNDYRDAELVFHSPEGEEVRGQMLNAHMPEYGDSYYARLKAFERQIIKEYDDPHSVMLTLSGSSENANGGWRCPADHLRDVVESWRPDRGRGVYHTLRYVLDGKEWKFAVVLEKHLSGYAHVHVAIFVDGAVTEEEFHSVIDAHLRKCQIAGKDAHDYLSPDPNKRPISVNRIDPGNAEDRAIRNLGSYIGEYIGAYGKELFERNLDELMFRASAWATGTQMVRFSKGANAMIDRERARPNTNHPDPTVRPNPAYDPELHSHPNSDIYPFEVDNPGWAIIGVARSHGDDEQVFEIHRSGVVWREIDDASQLDPPKPVPSDPPEELT